MRDKKENALAGVGTPTRATGSGLATTLSHQKNTTATQKKLLKKKSPKLVDWEQDYPLILPPINRIFGRDIRGIPYDAETNTGGVHWWTFLGAYNNLGDCTFAQVVRIRDKKARGKTLEKDEREWYRRNSDLVNIKNKLS